MSSKKNVCFYSNRCQWCKAFLQELSATPFSKDFTFVCVDPSPNRQKLPDWLKKVPTLVIQGEDEPRVDGEVFNWIALERMKGARSQQKDGAAAMPELEPEAFVANEMGMPGGSDPYSFIDMDTSAQGDGGYRLSYSYEVVGGHVASPQIPNVALTNKSDKKTKKEEMFDKQMEKYLMQRDSGIPMPLARS
jgi:hypothetical protein